MFDVGFAPVSVRIDLDSYDGDWRHVERFRNKSGWLVIAEATLSSANDKWRTSIIAACDEWGLAVPTFMAPNLLGCEWGAPETCAEYPPVELDSALTVSKRNVLVRWMRDSSETLARLAEDSAQRISRLEAETARLIATGDQQITNLRRRRRMLGPDDRNRETLDTIINEIERESDDALAELAQDRAAIRRWAAEEERRLIERGRGRIVTDRVAYIHWHALPQGCWTEELITSPAISGLSLQLRELRVANARARKQQADSLLRGQQRQAKALQVVQAREIAGAKANTRQA